MPIKKNNPVNVFPQNQNYSHAVEVGDNSRMLFISGLNGYEPDGKLMPDSFEEQARLIWTHIGTILHSANMRYDNIISL